MNDKAQAGMEYLLTYGWALILIATVIGMLVFVVMTPTSIVTFSSSDPTKIMAKGGTITGTTAEITLQNITGGKIEITGTGGCEIQPGTTIPAGGQITLICTAPDGIMPQVTINYTDYAGLDRSFEITASGTAASGTGGPAQPTVPTGYVSWWRLDEETAGITPDETGVNNGTLVDNATIISDAERGDVLSLDGTGAYVDVGDIGVESTDLTFIAWIKVNDFSADERAIVAKYAAAKSEKSFLWRITTTGRIGFYTHDGSTQTYKESNTVLDTGVWYQVGFVYDDSADDGTFYINGNGESGIWSTGTSFSEIQDTTTPLTIGRWASFNDNFNGSIDEVMIYNKALSPTEITQIFDIQKP